MPALPTTPGFNLVVVIGLTVFLWYGYQVLSRKRQRVQFKIQRLIVAIPCYVVAAMLLTRQNLPPIEVGILSLLAAFGAAWLLVKVPKHDRRIPADVRQAVIARDLTSKGLKWDSSKHHIDHVVPFSRGGDNSVRNLRVIAKTQNLRKGKKMPGLRDFLK